MPGTLLFNDDFNSFDAYSKTDSWRTSYKWGANTPINGETGYYVDTENQGSTGPAGAVNPFSVSNGVLTITSAPGSGLPNGQTYTSGTLTSYGSFAHQYGYYEVRAEMPGGKGFWPAFWLLPASGGSPPEIDIMEFSSVRPNEYVTTAHSVAGGKYQMSQKFQYGLPNIAQGFHTYAMNWQADKITWYFDDQAVYSIATPADMHVPMYMLLNQAVGGGSWIGAPDGSTQRFSVDHVRVYDIKPSATSGGVTAATNPTDTTTSTSTFGGGSTLGGDSSGVNSGGITTSPILQGIAGSPSDDRLVGYSASDRITSGSGHDTVLAGDGNDVVYGNLGNDVVYGNLGGDTLFGGQDADLVFGGKDADAVYGNLGADRLYGNQNDDMLFGGQGSDTLSGGQGNDVVRGNLGDDVLWGNLGGDTLAGGAGADTFVMQTGGGVDMVADFAWAEGDRIGVAGGMSWSVAEGTGGAVISLGSGDQLMLLNVRANEMNAAWFVSV